MKESRKTLLICLAIPFAAGGLSGWLSGNRMETFQTLNQPPLSPPGWVFPIVWTVLYLLMGWASYRIYTADVPELQSGRALGIYALQLIVNFAWSLFFFHLGWYLFSLLWLILLWVLIWIMIILFVRIDPTTWWMLAPYLIWVTFAAYLNWGVWMLN